MPDKVTIVRPSDGKLLDASPEQADRLRILGYAPETPDQQAARLQSEAVNDYYSAGDQQALAGLEGFNSGLTFGLSDYLLGDDETKLRATYNPGTRLGGEALGALAPLLLTGGESAGATAGRMVDEAGVLSKAARYAPPSLLAEGAEAATAGLREGSLTKAVARGALEGAVYGGAGAADHAYLDGDPVTAEAVLHGIGWGAILGGGLGAVGHGLSKAGEAAEAAELSSARVNKTPGPSDLSVVGKDAYVAVQSEAEALKTRLSDAVNAADEVVRGVLSAPRSATSIWGEEVSNELRKTAETAYNRAMRAADAGKGDVALAAAKDYQETAAELGRVLKYEMPDVGSAMKQLIELRGIKAEIGRLPPSVEQFATMGSNKAERLFAAIDAAKGAAVDGRGLESATKELSRAFGVDADQSTLRGAWNSAKQMYRGSAKAVEPPPEPHHRSLLREMAGYAVGGKVYLAAKAAGFGRPTALSAYIGAKNLVRQGAGTAELGTIRNAVIGNVRRAAADYLPGAGKAVARSAPNAAPLAMSLVSGRMDSDTKDMRELAARRVAEVAKLGPVINDYLYKQVEPLMATQPQLAPALHAAGVKSFLALAALMPKNPGVVSKLQNIWKPSDVHAVMLAKQLEVFHDPVGVAQAMLAKNDFDPIKIQTLRETAPNMWQELRVGLLDRISDPKVRDKMSYQDQIGLSAMLDIPIHTSMTPEFIASSQQMFLDRNQGQKANPRVGQNGGLPNPEDNINSTQSDRVTAR